MSPLIWAILLVVLAIVLIILEAFVPSGGLLSLFAMIAVVAGVWIAYQAGMWAGHIFLVVNAVLLPAVVVLLVQWWPHTPLGKTILIQPPPADELIPESNLDDSLVGLIGIAVNRMLPSGAVKVEGRLIDAVSEGMAIEEGASVEIVSVRGNHIVVRPATNEALQKAKEVNMEQTTAFDAVIPDPFDEPLT